MIVGKELAAGFDVMDPFSMRHQWFTCVRLSYAPDEFDPAFFNRNVHYLAVFGSATYGYLKPSSRKSTPEGLTYLEYGTGFKHQTGSGHEAPRRELHPLKSGAFRGARLRQLAEHSVARVKLTQAPTVL